MSAAGGDLVQR